MRRSHRLSALVLGVVALLSIATTTASAAEKPPSRSDFSAQAASAGLSAEQVSWLQAEVDRNLASVGGVQTAPNRIQLDGAVLTIALPGEPHPRTFTATSARAATVSAPTAAAAACAYGHFCAYQGLLFTGSVVDAYRCNVERSLPGWVNRGSYHNNQSRGTVARFFNQYGVLWEGSVAAPASENNYNWNPIYTILPC